MPLLFFIMLLEVGYLVINSLYIHRQQAYNSERKLSSRLASSKELSSIALYWETRIRKVGAKIAYEEFKKKVEGLDPGKQHRDVHIFGEILFYMVGLDGVSICDSNFAYGCYHSFLGTAIHNKGLEIITYLGKECAKKLMDQGRGCQHAIGHGIITELGYKIDALISGLDYCDKVSPDGRIGGCRSGIFMEYNFRTMLESDHRILDENNLYYPCNLVYEKYRPSCYFWQAQLWIDRLPGSYGEKYKRLGSLCKGLVVKDELENCFLGSGNTIGQRSEWKIEEAMKLCMQIESFNGQVLCRAGAAGAFFAEPTTKTLATKFCDGLDGKNEEYCLEKAGTSIGSLSLRRLQP